ncbi:unnamed protein product [Prunus brigantina]
MSGLWVNFSLGLFWAMLLHCLCVHVRAQCTSKSRMTISRVAMMPQNIGCPSEKWPSGESESGGLAPLRQPHSQLAIVLVEMCCSFGGAGLCQSNGV